MERQITHDITYTWNLKYDTNEQLQNRKSLKAIGDRLGVTKGEEAGEGQWELLPARGHRVCKEGKGVLARPTWGRAIKLEECVQ